MYRTLLTCPPLFGEERHPITGEYDWTFPRLIICSNSMHSKQKLLRYGMDQRLIEQFYGSYEEYAGMNRSEWKEIVRKRLIHFACKSKSDMNFRFNSYPFGKFDLICASLRECVRIWDSLSNLCMFA